MIINNTPVEHFPDLDLWVKREDLCCPPPGPPFSKTRGVFVHIKNRPESIIGVLDTYHSQAGHAVARACQILGKTCLNFYPHYKREPIGLIRPAQQRAFDLGAKLKALPAGRSAILYHRAKKLLPSNAYMMPNALKLKESVDETANEVMRTSFPANLDTLLIPISSGTIAAGVLKGLDQLKLTPQQIILHMGYTRSQSQIRRYITKQIEIDPIFEMVDENYNYSDPARSGPTPKFPCNAFYDLKTYRWIHSNRDKLGKIVMLWNIG